MKEPVFYCQLDYAHVKFPAPGSGFGDLANNGCGPLAVSMLIENMLGIPFPPEESAAFFLSCGARVAFGTNLYIASEAVAERFGLSVTNTEDPDEAYAFLASGRGMVIANTYGDRPEDGYIGVFSDSGHYILLTGAEDGRVSVLDSMYRPGRFDKPGRAGKVTMEGPLAHADFAVIASDCVHRPFFLFEKTNRNDQ
ncbi:MAG: C39 family peptidase [Clostridiales bacterium]|nr:C39 family peptidase [Clostridiales bacterium]